MLFIISFGVEVQGFDEIFEIITLGIQVLKSVFADVILVVEFGDLFFFVELETFIFIPIISSKFFEKIILLLTFLWRWVLSSLSEIEWESQKLLSVGRSKLLVTIERINCLFVGLKILLKLLDKQVESAWWQWLLNIVGLVDKSLEGNWIVTGLFDLLWVTESEVFKTMDLTESPENIIFIFSLSLELPLLLEFGINLSSVSESIKHLGLGKWTRSVNIEVVLDLLLRVSMSNTVFEQAEFADQVVIGQVAILSDTLGSRALIIKFVGQFWEESSMELRGDPETGSESCSLDWCSHPGFSEQRISVSSLLLEWTCLPGSESSDRTVKHELSTLDLLIFKNLLSTNSIIAILGLNALNFEFTLF